MPVNPGSVPIIAAKSTGAQITELCYAFDTASALFNEYNCTDKDLQKNLLSTVDKIFIRSLSHKYVRYGLTTTHAILDYLYATYSNISYADLQEKDAVFRTPYDINQPIESLFDRFKNCGDYAAAGNTPYSLEQVIGIALQIVYQTSLFLDDCKAWKLLPIKQKIGLASKISLQQLTTNVANPKAPPQALNSTPSISCRRKTQLRSINRKLSTP